jgi:hypothetical protein
LVLIEIAFKKENPAGWAGFSCSIGLTTFSSILLYTLAGGGGKGTHVSHRAAPAPIQLLIQ